MYELFLISIGILIGAPIGAGVMFAWLTGLQRDPKDRRFP